jgi:hypothetical protein
MNRYYFDIVADEQVTVDEEGELLLNLETAQQEASLSLTEIAREELRAERTIARLAIVVRDVKGPVCEIAYRWDPKSLQ